MDLHDKENVYNNLQCSNCSLNLSSESYIDSYALPLTGKTITVYEALQTIFKGYENISTLSLINCDEIIFCNSCGIVFGKLFGLYTQFMELSTLDSIIHNIINQFHQQFINQSKLTHQLPLIVSVNSLQHNPPDLNSDAGFYLQHEDVKIEIDDFPQKNGVTNQLRRSGRFKKPKLIPDASSLMESEPESGDDNFLHSNTSTDAYDQNQKDSNYDSDKYESDETYTVKHRPFMIKKIAKVNLDHNLRLFECNVCKIQFKTQRSFNRHSFVHKEPSYLCDLCGGRFKTHMNLKQHEQIHYGKERPLKFECDICHKKVCTKTRLKWHMDVVHSNAEPYQCQECGKRFKARYLLNLHKKRIHVLKITLPHSCELCEKRYSLKWNLKEHLMSHHKLSKDEANISAKIEPNNIFRILPNGDRVCKESKIKKSCEFCNKTYTRLDNLCMHLVKVHRKTEEEAKSIAKINTKTVVPPETSTAAATNHQNYKQQEQYVQNFNLHP